MESFYGVPHARVLCGNYLRQYNQERPHSALNYQTPEEFAAVCVRRPVCGRECTKEDLSHYALPMKQDGPAPKDQPDRIVIHDGAQVASQQSLILRVDQSSVNTVEPAGNGPACDKARV